MVCLLMKTSLLSSVGRACYGSLWQSAIARDLGVTPRTVVRWLAVDAMPDDMVERLRPVVRRRYDEIALARKSLWSDLS